ncbi:MAG: sulfur oxidation c-type cytochrome SoxX [Rhizobiales bacterium 32-66-11]|jgi:L-cysteine S-thiosulfotransferase|nr:MAG: sulfur oxidation c-type cytochrome SoxX [Rhizobiales bacterium 32-66-11]
MKRYLIAVAAALLLPQLAAAQQAPVVDTARVDAVVKESFTKLPEGWAERLIQDETMRICSQTRNAPSPAQAEAIVAREAALVKFPADGVMGNWKEGAKIAQNGRGGQFSDPPGTVSGGNCYACHQMDPKEVSYGTLGPSLTNYGRDRKFDPADAKAAYAKVFDPQAVFACSSMPRFGVHNVLSEQQMKDVIAYLFDPESPVNKPAK